MSGIIKEFKGNGQSEYGLQIKEFQTSYEFNTLLHCLTEYGVPKPAAVNALRRAFGCGWNAGKDKVIIRHDRTAGEKRKGKKLECCEGGPIDPVKFKEIGEIVVQVITQNMDHQQQHDTNRRGRPSKLIYSREECAFNCCPTAAECRSKNKCCNG